MSVSDFRPGPAARAVGAVVTFATVAACTTPQPAPPRAPSSPVRVVSATAESAMGRMWSCPAPRPEYPAAAAQAMAMGVTRFRAEWDADGRVRAVTVLRSAGESKEHRLLDRAIVEFVSTCRWTRPDSPTSSTVMEYAWLLE